MKLNNWHHSSVLFKGKYSWEQQGKSISGSDAFGWRDLVVLPNIYWIFDGKRKQRKREWCVFLVAQLLELEREEGVCFPCMRTVCQSVSSQYQSFCCCEMLGFPTSHMRWRYVTVTLPGRTGLPAMLTIARRNAQTDWAEQSLPASRLTDSQKGTGFVSGNKWTS